MAWQLIYTSAPRLLEAGRSGFGTVARHRQIPPLLVAAIERFSQFSRLPGLDPGRLIFAYRTVAVGSGRFSVLSFIRDAGADYTGRTNHLAHHLILEPREVAALGRHGPSPANVLLAAPWRQTWDEPPRWLDDSDEIPVTRILPQTSADGATWAQVTGDPHHAWLLTQGEASRAACLLTPHDLDLRPLFAESLRLTPERLWQTSFTTSLQPSDDPADFRWLGVEAGTELAATASNGRIVFDLRDPQSLPLVEFAAPSGFSSPIPPQETPAPAWSFSGATAKSAPSVSEPLGRFARQKDSPPKSATGDPFGDSKPARHLNRTHILIAVGILILLAAAGAGTWWQMNRKAQEEQRRQILATLKGASYFNDLNIESELKKWLAGLNGDQLVRLPEFARAATDLARPLSQSSTTIPEKPGAKKRLDELAQQAGILAQDLPRSISTLGNRLDEAADWRQTFSEFRVTPGNYDELMKRWRDFDQPLGPLKEEPFTHLRNRLRAIAASKRVDGLQALIGGPEEPKGGAKWFRAALGEITDRDLDQDAATRARYAKLRQFGDDWSSVENDGAADVQTRLNAPGSADWQPWLKRLARRKLPKDSQPAALSLEQPSAGTKPASKNQASPAGALYFAKDNESLAELSISELAQSSLTFTIDPPRDGKAELVPFGGDITHGLGANGEVFKVSDGAIKPGKTAPAPPYQLIIARDSAPAAHVYVGPRADGTPLLDQKPRSGPVFSVQGDSLKFDAGRLNLPGKISQPLWLNVPPNFSRTRRGSTSVVVNDWNVDLKDPRAEAARERAELEQRIVAAKKAVESASNEKGSSFDRNTFLQQVNKGGILGKDFKIELPKDGGDSDVKFFYELIKELSNVWGKVKDGDFIRADEIFAVAEKNLKEPANLADAFQKVANDLRLLTRKIGNDDDRKAAEPLQILENQLTALSADAANPGKKQEERKQAAAKQLAEAQAALEAFKRRSIAEGHVPPGNYILQVEVSGGDRLPLLEIIVEGETPK